MAQYDTGQGWSAKEEWLFAGTGTVANVGGFGFPGYSDQPIPKNCTNYAGTVSGGFVGFTYTRNQGYSTYYYGAQNNDDALMCLVQSSSTTYSPHAISLTQNATVLQVDVRSAGPQYNGSYTLSSHIDVGGTSFYYRDMPAMQISQMLQINIPIFNTIQEACAAISIAGTAYNKLNPGYAVVCGAEWITPAGTILRSPILISPDSAAVVMTTDGTTPATNMEVFDFMYDGLRFYMSLIAGNSDTVTTNFEYANLTQFMAAMPSKVFSLLASESFANILITETVDPYEDFGNTGEDGGEVDPDPEDDDIEEDDLPTISFASAGFCRIYKPSLLQLNDLADYLWTDQTFLQTVINHLKQIIENPIDAIISLSLVPCVPPTSSDVEVKVMYIPTGVYMPPVTNQFVEVDCGTVELKEMYGSALDYNPYTSVQLYLPYVGIVQLDTDEVMGKTLRVGYRIDVVTGVCCAYVKAGPDVLYQFSGHCSIQQPITSADFSGYVGAAIAAGKLVASIAAAGAGAPEVAATLAGAPTPSISGTSSETRITERNEATGRQITAGTRRKETVTENPGASFGEVATRGISNTVGAVMNSKTIVQHSGGFSGNSGYLAAVRRPYLIVTRPRIANPEKYGQFNGRPSMIYLNLGSCTGFTQVQSIQLTGIDATNPELSEITTLLTSGVIF